MQLLSADGLLIWVGKEYSSKTDATIMCSRQTKGRPKKSGICQFQVKGEGVTVFFLLF